ncbi:unnamed protein product [Chrysoparadoxa australica]
MGLRPVILLLLAHSALSFQGAGFLGERLAPASQSHGTPTTRPSGVRMEVFEGNPVGKWAWENVWKLPLFQKGEQGAPTTFGDAANVFKGNIEQIYGDEPSPDGCPMAEGEVEGMMTGNLFLGLQEYYRRLGGSYKLCFGPKSFIVVSDPVIARHILRDNAKAYDKGVLAEILEPIMGKGLIPADPETWKVRRRAIVPGFHNAWLNAMMGLFSDCNFVLIDKLGKAADASEVVEMESNFCSVSLDIIGKSIFNYEFGSVTSESPVIKSVYSVLKESEHRAMTPLPYWNLPLANLVVPRLRKFNADLAMLDDVLDELIELAKDTREEAELEDLQARNYDKVQDVSMLRFLVDLRGEDTTTKQLRDDLMTMLIAGHETTAAVLTWAMFELAQQPDLMEKARQEIDSVLGPISDENKDRKPTLDDLKKMQFVRLCVAESLRMYPEPPLLIRRALEDDVLPRGTAGFETKIARGTDIFIGIYNMHNSPEFYENPEKFDPERFLKPFSNEKAEGWAGYDPAPLASQLYPNEIASDFSFLPFGGGQRKCVGDQFAYMEATVTLALLLQRFDFSLAVPPEAVGVFTGATIHTRNGLPMHIRRRSTASASADERVAEPAVSA